MRRPREIMPFAQAAQPVCSRDSTRSHSVTCLPASSLSTPLPHTTYPHTLQGRSYLFPGEGILGPPYTDSEPTLRARSAARPGILIEGEGGGKPQRRKDPLDHRLRLRAQTWQRPHYGACTSQGPICCFQNGCPVDV